MSEVADRIRSLIRERGPITFAEYMQEALYGPGGFYERTPVGERGHFVTSPHVHPVFSRLVGAAIEELWRSLGRPAPFRLVEVGAGDGTMGRELVGGFERGGVELAYTAVETSRGAHEALADAGIHVVLRLADLPALDPGVVVANELLDNLPFRRVRGGDGSVVEIRIDVEGPRLVETATPCDDELLAIAPPLGDGEEAVVPVGALDLVGELGRTMRTGYALLIDYGSDARAAGDVHGYREHRVVEDPLEDPGSADITAGVDLGAVARRARDLGLSAFDPVPQSDALLTLGLDAWMRAERSRQGALLDAERGADAVRAFDGRNRARLLADPAGLGRLRWLVLATSGLVEPEWLVRSRRRPPLD